MRRRFLMGMVLDKGIWENYSYTNLYHSLIPQTIDSKNVLNKARLGTIEGNSVVENQLLDNLHYYGGTLTITQNGNGSFVFNGTANTNNLYLIGNNVIPNGHKVLIALNKTLTNCKIRLGGEELTDSTHIVEQNYGGALVIEFTNGTTFTNYEITVNVVDLTQRYPFDTPTTLDDVRVQNILAQGYIPYNTGEIKDTLISELEAQPYNLFDEILEGGAYDTDTGQPLSDNRFERSKNYISVVGGLQYSLENSGEINTYQYAQRHILEYDGNYNFIRADIQYNSQSQFLSPFNQTLDNNCRYIRINFYYGSTQRTITDVCFHRTGTRTGYATHEQPSTLQLPAPLQIGGVNTAHNTFEVTNTGFVFTKKMAVVDLGSLTPIVLSQGTSNERVYIDFSLAKTPNTSSSLANIYCEKYMTASVDNVYSHTNNNIIAIHNTNGGIYIYSSELIGLTAQQIQAKLLNTYLWYETEDEVADFTNSVNIQSGGTLNSDSVVLPNVEMEMKCK